MNLKNAVALVTGGSSGIGHGIAKSLIDSGARVAITGRDKAKLDKAAKELGAHPIQADVSKEADALRTMREVLEKFGDLDILVNNAGLGCVQETGGFRSRELRAHLRHQRHRRDADGARGGQALRL